MNYFLISTNWLLLITVVVCNKWFAVVMNTTKFVQQCKKACKDVPGTVKGPNGAQEDG